MISAENTLRAVAAINDLIDEAARIEREHGFGDQSPGEDIALMHSELSEALEDIRAGKPLNALEFEPKQPIAKPVGVPSELADVLIRVFGFCSRHDIDLADAVLKKMAYNESRSFRHGGKIL